MLGAFSSAKANDPRNLVRETEKRAAAAVSKRKRRGKEDVRSAVLKTNTEKGSARRGQKFRETTDAEGRKVHVYTTGERVTVYKPSAHKRP